MLAVDCFSSAHCQRRDCPSPRFFPRCYFPSSHPPANALNGSQVCLHSSTSSRYVCAAAIRDRETIWRMSVCVHGPHARPPPELDLSHVPLACRRQLQADPQATAARAPWDRLQTAVAHLAGTSPRASLSRRNSSAVVSPRAQRSSSIAGASAATENLLMLPAPATDADDR